VRTVGLVLPVVGPVVGGAEAEGLTERPARVADGLVKVGGDGAAGVVFGPSDTPGICTAGLGVRSGAGVAGLNVATDSIAPATRHTARMLASSGMTLPRAAKGANGPASRRSRLRRRLARSSRW
jgi:hypothetical protein